METKHTGGKNMIRSPLANKLKELRVKNQLSTVVLSEQFGISSTHIYYLENDKRGLSDELLRKYSEFFHISFEELKEIQRNSELMVKNFVSEEPSDLKDVDEFISLIMSVEKPLRKQFMDECTEKLQGMYYSFLTPYGLNDLKKCLTSIRNSWYSLEEIAIEEEKIEGNLKLPEQEIYFKLVVNQDVCCVELLYEDQRKIEHFTKWITQPDCNIICQSKIPHLAENQKVKIFYWFSPKCTENQHFKFLKEQHEDLTQLYIQSFKLELLVKNYLKQQDEIA